MFRMCFLKFRAGSLVIPWPHGKEIIPNTYGLVEGSQITVLSPPKVTHISVGSWCQLI